MNGLTQLTTFYVAGELYGIEVMRVQEVTGNPEIVPVPLSPPSILGMVNLRGQITTALSARVLFGHPEDQSMERMSVVCKVDGSLFSLVVDSIGDVAEVNPQDFETPPITLPNGTRKILKGVYKMEKILLCMIDLENLFKELSRSLEIGDEGSNIETRRTA